MDTKLRNKIRTRRLFIAAAVILCSVIMLFLYPYFGKKADEKRGENIQHSILLNTIADTNYVLYRDGKKQNGEAYDPMELYLPKLEKAITYSMLSGGSDATQEGIAFSVENSYSDYISDIFYSDYNDWENECRTLGKKLDYQIIDKNEQKVLLTNLKEGVSWDQAAYQLLVQIDYDENGNPEIKEFKGFDSEELKAELKTKLESNPLEEYYESNIKYDTQYEFSNPKNCSVFYGMTEAQEAAATAGTDFWEIENAYYWSGDVQVMFLALAAFIAILALLFPYLNLGYTGKERLYRGYLEAALIVLFFALCNPGHISVVAYNNAGIWRKVLAEVGLLPVAAKLLILAANLLWWSLHFLVIYWAVACLRMIFVLGPRQYIRERCYCYRILMYGRSLIRRMVQWVYQVVEDMERSTASNRTVLKIVVLNFLILSAITILWAAGIPVLLIYSVILYRILVKYYRDRNEKYQILLHATNELAEGNLDVSIDEDLGMFDPFKVELQKIQHGFKKAVDEEVKSQRMKTDLISNVSHDLKTPLTAIITYVDLLKDETITPEQRASYVEVLDKKSMRLKVLIEDIFEISKATSQNVTLNLVEMDIVNLLKQVRLELGDKIEESGLDFRWNLPEYKIVLMLDSQKTFRIFENLLLNIVKYALPGTRAYVDMAEENGQVVIRMKNVSAVELTINPEDMTERFARGDQARNTEGSGLGLAIVKSFVELQKGKLELETEADLFKATIRWNLDKR